MRLLLWSLTPHAMATTNLYATLKQTSAVLYTLTLTIVVLVVGCNRPVSEEPSVDAPKVESTYDCTECPSFTDGKDTLAFVNEVRSFIAQRADAGLIANQLCKDHEEIGWDTLPVQAFLDLFEKDLGAASPLLCSRLMVKILNENGLDAYTYVFGPKDSDFTHAVVLVKHGSELWITDPRVNYTLYEMDGSPMDLFRLIEMSGNGNLQYSTGRDMVEGDLLLDYKLIRGDYAKRINTSACQAFVQDQKTIRDSITKTIVERCYPCERARGCFSLINRMESELRRTTGLTDYHETLALPNAWLNGPGDTQELSNRIETHIYSQPNLGKRVNSNRVKGT